ncbi:MAG: hypothetical protein HYZ83_01295 [Candidatus Omnitrophica bacterium]|nr:hypothetical protein [Candidatus Omnitrophota bacterium]
MKFSKIFNLFLTAAVLAALFYAVFWIYRWSEEARVLREIVERLSSDSRIAEVLVTKSEFDETTKKIHTTIKFLEYSAAGQEAASRPLAPKYFTFEGNIIQFQALVIRFNDKFVRAGDKLRGKSAYLFLKAFVLDEENTQMFKISDVREIPAGYKIPGEKSKFEEKLWRQFWEYALNPKIRERAGIKSAQIEAPGSLFLPGTIYTLRIEHDGGIRIDTRPIPEVLKGEKL